MSNASPAIETVPVTAIVTAYRRAEQTLETLVKLFNCRPPPGEVLVHVDGGEARCARAIRDKFPDVDILISKDNIGPGGGRNKLIAAANHDWVASFDDDSYPLDVDYFQRLHEVIQVFPEASVICARVFHRGETLVSGERAGQWAADFSGGACAYRRRDFLQTAGYVPLPVAYGMEEVDLAMQLHAQGRTIFQTGWLRIFHDTNLDHHQDPRITSASITNLALLAYLRYPASCWWIGFVQVVKRILWLNTHGRRQGIFSGLFEIPGTLYKLRRYRNTLSRSALTAYFSLRRNPPEAVLFTGPGEGFQA